MKRGLMSYAVLCVTMFFLMMASACEERTCEEITADLETEFRAEINARIMQDPGLIAELDAWQAKLEKEYHAKCEGRMSFKRSQ
jgi:hypothetical protein